MNKKKFVIRNTSGQYWTGECWGVIQAAESYARDELYYMYLDEECNPSTFFDNDETDIGWGNEDGEGFASAQPIRTTS